MRLPCSIRRVQQETHITGSCLTFWPLNISYWCRNPGLYHKWRSRLIPWSLYSVNCNCHFPIFPFQWSASWRCVPLICSTTLSVDASAAAAAEAAVAEGDDDDEAEARGGVGGWGVREATVTVTASGFSSSSSSFFSSSLSLSLDPLTFVISQEGEKDVRRSVINIIIIIMFIRLKPIHFKRSFPVRINYAVMKEIEDCSHVLLLFPIFNMHPFNCTHICRYWMKRLFLLSGVKLEVFGTPTNLSGILSLALRWLSGDRWFSLVCSSHFTACP